MKPEVTVLARACRHATEYLQGGGERNAGFLAK